MFTYSIGNENGETATPEGLAQPRAMVDRCRALDPTRAVTAGVNAVLKALARLGKGRRRGMMARVTADSLSHQVVDLDRDRHCDDSAGSSMLVEVPAQRV